MHCDCFINFKDFVFVDDKLSAETAIIMSLEICTYTVFYNQLIIDVSGAIKLTLYCYQ